MPQSRAGSMQEKMAPRGQYSERRLEQADKQADRQDHVLSQADALIKKEEKDRSGDNER